jgi:5-methylcytosine-specific restriction endonuclease McrA
MFKLININDRIQHQYNSVATRGRELEEVVAHWFNYTYDLSAFKLGQPELWKLYQIQFEGDDFPLERISKKFEKYLKKLDIALRSFNKPEMVGKKVLFLSYIVLKKMRDEGYKINIDTFFKHLTSSLTALKKADKTVKFINRNKQEKMNFKQLFRLASTLEAINVITDMIIEKMLPKGSYVTTDVKRQYTKDERHAKWVEQGECCGYCGDSVEFKYSVADHKEPHSEGGETTYENLTVSCKKCNGMKSSLPYETWMQVLPTLKIYDYSQTSSIGV